jgi:hypothetical protein
MTGFIETGVLRTDTTVFVKSAVCKWIENVVIKILNGLKKEKKTTLNFIEKIVKLLLNEKNRGFRVIQVGKVISSRQRNTGRKTLINDMPMMPFIEPSRKKSCLNLIFVRFAMTLDELRLIILLTTKEGGLRLSGFAKTVMKKSLGDEKWHK